MSVWMETSPCGPDQDREGNRCRGRRRDVCADGDKSMWTSSPASHKASLGEKRKGGSSSVDVDSVKN